MECVCNRGGVVVDVVVVKAPQVGGGELVLACLAALAVVSIPCGLAVVPIPVPPFLRSMIDR